jgi:hypothetical protein
MTLCHIGKAWRFNFKTSAAVGDVVCVDGGYLDQVSVLAGTDQ